MRSNGVVLLSLLLTAPAETLAQSAVEPATEGLAALVRSYPEFLDRIEGNELLWKDGTRMRVDGGKGPKPLDAMLDDPDVKDMFLMRYPLGEKGVPPEPNFDPGRVRYLPLFNKMYGDCRSAGFMANATNVLGCRVDMENTYNSPELTGRRRSCKESRTNSTDCRPISSIISAPPRAPTIAA